MLKVSEKEEGLVALNLPNGPLKSCCGLEPVTVNPVSTSPLANELATAPLGLVLWC